MRSTLLLLLFDSCYCCLFPVDVAVVCGARLVAFVVAVGAGTFDAATVSNAAVSCCVIPFDDCSGGSRRRRRRVSSTSSSNRSNSSSLGTILMIVMGGVVVVG